MSNLIIEGEVEKLAWDHYLKTENSIKSIFIPHHLIMNNLYCISLMDGLIENSDIKVPWQRDDNSTVFCSEQLMKDFQDCFDLFFYNKWRTKEDSTIGLEPEVEGKLADFALEGFSIVSDNIAARVKNNVTPAVSTFYMAAFDSYPIQFTAKSEDLNIDIDEDIDFKVNEFLWFCIRPGGFVLSLSSEDFGILEVLMSKLIRDKVYGAKERAKLMFKPSVQERMYKAWGIFYQYLRDTGKLKSAYIRL